MSTLGGATTLGGPGSNNNNDKKDKPTTTLGGPKPAATTLGGGATLGGPKPATTLGGGAPTTLGGTPTTLGGAPTTLGGAAETGGTTGGAKKRRRGKKKTAKGNDKKGKKGGEKKGGKKKKTAKQRMMEEVAARKAEKERIRLEQERLDKEEEEREARRLVRIEEERVRKEKEAEERAERAKKLKAQRAGQDRSKAREQMMKQYGAHGVQVGKSKAQRKKEEAEKPKEKPVEKPTETEEESGSESTMEDWDDASSTSEVLDNWDASSSEEDSEEQRKLEEAERIREETERVKREREERLQKEKEEAEARKKANLEKQKKTQFRSPICCVLGHVDTGKTLLLDKMRNTKVQDGEAGGITQQIGATFFPLENIKEMTSALVENIANKKMSYKVPGLLVIDTPGHASFTNLRSRGSSLCDIAVVVVDIMHGVEEQTKESISLLRRSKTPFIVALNKVDRLYGWEAETYSPFKQSLKRQPEHVQAEFKDRANKAIADLAIEEINAELYYKNSDFRSNVSMVPCSAMTGEGIPDLLLLLVQLTQKLMASKLVVKDELECTVLEVQKIPGIGTTLDVILINGTLKTHDNIMIAGLNNVPIETSIKALLTPPPMSESRVKTDYIRNKVIHAAMGLKISANGLEHAVAGSQLYLVNKTSNVVQMRREVMRALENIQNKIDKSSNGVYVQASTLGSMEALLDFLMSDCNIPVSGIRIGPVHKKDVIQASAMIERQKPEYAVILAFDVPITNEANDYATRAGVRIFSADIIYHLEDMFLDYLDEIKLRKEHENREKAVFPCVLEIIDAEHVYKTRDPIVVGVKVVKGIAKMGTPIVVAVPGKDLMELGTITGLERNHENVDIVNQGEEVCVCITPTGQKYLLGRQFDIEHKLVSHITYDSLGALKEGFPSVVEEHRDVLRRLCSVFGVVGL